MEAKKDAACIVCFLAVFLRKKFQCRLALVHSRTRCTQPKRCTHAWATPRANAHTRGILPWGYDYHTLSIGTYHSAVPDALKQCAASTPGPLLGLMHLSAASTPGASSVLSHLPIGASPSEPTLRLQRSSHGLLGLLLEQGIESLNQATRWSALDDCTDLVGKAKGH